MGDEEEKEKKRPDDYTEIEFELGELEFEAKGKAKVVERMFTLLLEKLETGKLKAITSTVKELEGIVDDLEGEEEEEEEEDEEGEEEEVEEKTEEPEAELPELPPVDEEVSDESTATDGSLDPAPTWDSLDEPPDEE